MHIGHDTLMGIALVIAGGLTIACTRSSAKALPVLTVIGAVVTIIIGLLLFFGLA